jgi:hypothetical protein
MVLSGFLILLTLQTGYADSKPQEQRTFFFAGLEWEAESSFNKTMNPGQNYFSSAEDTVWVDQRGWLHLKIHDNGLYSKWSCASIHSAKPVSYGTHRFQVIGHLGTLDKNVVLGLFLYKADQKALDQHAEIDFEFSTWGFPRKNDHGVWAEPCSNAQMVLWPSWFGDFSPQPALMSHYYIHSTQTTMTTHDLQWNRDQISLKSYWYHDTPPQEEDLIFSSQANPKDNPMVFFPTEDDQMLLNINLWLNDFSETTSDKEPLEVIIKYEFFPSGQIP